MSDDAEISLHPAATVVRRSVTVDVDQQRAFDVFTQGMDVWWPPDHHLGSTAMTKMTVEPRVGGRCFSSHEDGAEITWATVLSWEPPSRLVIGWHINADWRCDPSFVTEVEVTFMPDGTGSTLVELEHRDLERFGDRQGEIVASLDADGGWPGILRRYAAAADGRDVNGA